MEHFDTDVKLAWLKPVENGWALFRCLDKFNWDPPFRQESLELWI